MFKGWPGRLGSGPVEGWFWRSGLGGRLRLVVSVGPGWRGLGEKRGDVPWDKRLNKKSYLLTFFSMGVGRC